MNGSGKDTNPKDVAAATKLPLWLCSAIAKAHWCVAQFAGLLKYGAWNWRKAGVRASVYTSALRRHIDAWENGEECDPIDGTHHLGNVMACAAILLDARAAGKLIDDRPPSVSVRPTYGELEAVMATLRKQYANKSPRHYTIADTEPAPAPARARPASQLHPAALGHRARARPASQLHPAALACARRRGRCDRSRSAIAQR